MTKNNWFQTNLGDRKNGLCDFEIKINPYKFKAETFRESCDRLAKELSEKHNKLYVSYSGGLDSEFVLKTFIDLKLPITPILVSTSFNQQELSYAINFCKENNMTPEIIEFSNEDLIKRLQDKTHKRNMFALLGGLPLIICDYINDKGGKLVTGYGEPFWTTRKGFNVDLKNLELCEWDYYLNDYDETHPAGFFVYDIGVFYSLIKEVDYTKNFNDAKIKLYNLKPRDKMFWNQNFQDLAWQLNKNNKPNVYSHHIHKDDLIKLLEEYII